MDTSTIAPAQADLAAIRTLLQQSQEAWNRGDGTAYGACFTDDATDVTYVGTIYHGGSEIGRAHQALFDSFLKDSRLLLEIVGIRLYGTDTAVVVTRGDVSKGKPKKLGKLATYTLIRQADDHCDASHLDYADNLTSTRSAATWAHNNDLWIEAELGEIGGKDGVHSPTARTDAGEAAAYVADTGVDALAVAVGSSHAMTSKSASLDIELVGELRAAVPVPLVLHGSSGVLDGDLRRAVAAGLTKINVGTQLNEGHAESLVRPSRRGHGNCGHLPPARRARSALADAHGGLSALRAPMSRRPGTAGPSHGFGGVGVLPCIGRDEEDPQGRRE
ncbi:SgcJ/EcaC family oxidoreductase [Actinoallomurus purpureus]|uniref:SgcJ/EcaC family oxidoreductase n=1 Tax=Actinoallomurus purpureus TaxID=478114 RepID=UPI0020924FF5|nr:SgcJ/EcaC family oxidoreductase [Actinoallomurus purpureus]MCO6010520.1 SgcJ/EcaC family oxidoreductase [Actinoallomurus purpureus]